MLRRLATRRERGQVVGDAAIVVAGVVFVLAICELLYLLDWYSQRGRLADDYIFYVELAQRFLRDGTLYGDRQLTGHSYTVLVNIDNIYPPPSIALFIPFAFLPAVLWWLIPLGVLAYTVWRLKPARWTWPLLAVCLVWPRTIGSLVVGNSDIWSAALVAGGILWGWPGALGLFKPAFGPFALAGARRRSWWVAAGFFTAWSAILWPYWGQYLVVASNWDVPITRSIANIPLLLLPVIAWLGRSRTRHSPSNGLSQ